MSEEVGINRDCAMLWRTVAQKGGWWCALRLAREWMPTFALAEVEQHLNTLHRGGFLQARHHSSLGIVYGFTECCRPIPGEDGIADTQGCTTCVPRVPEPRRPDVMHTHYRPPQPLYRAGALDHLRYPSLLLGKRVLRRAQP